MPKKMSFLMACLILMLPLLVHGFDCNNPDFGARIEDLNKDGSFVWYMEKGGISYYNYTGPCRMKMHNHANPKVSFAFIQDQLYARIVNIPEQEGQIEDIRDKQLGTQPYSLKQDGDWWIYQWYNEKDNLTYKVKVNSKTNEGKSVCYYESLRAKLKNMTEADDPASLAD
jgi:hypothetical protein